MALSLGSLTAYTRQSVQPLLTSAVFGARTQELIIKGGIVLPNVKSSQAIPLMDTDAVFATQTSKTLMTALRKYLNDWKRRGAKNM